VRHRVRRQARGQRGTGATRDRGKARGQRRMGSDPGPRRTWAAWNGQRPGSKAKSAGNGHRPGTAAAKENGQRPRTAANMGSVERAATREQSQVSGERASTRDRGGQQASVERATAESGPSVAWCQCRSGLRSQVQASQDWNGRPSDSPSTTAQQPSCADEAKAPALGVWPNTVSALQALGVVAACHAAEPARL